MPDLYAALGATPADDHAAIRRKYRRAAKDAHPDKPGGSAEKFALVKTAHDVLTDPQRRERYDQTGDAGEKTIDNSVAEALSLLNRALDEALGALGQRGQQAHETADLLKMMAAALHKQRTGIRARIADFTIGIAVNEKLAGRFKDKSGQGRMEMVIRARVAQFHDLIAANERLLPPIAMALAILDEHTFKADTAPRPAQGFSVMEFLHNQHNQHARSI